ncbi:hypothetical protein [Sphingomonas olei]|uniref:XRE family transcriptional regulator n=1 Tax=Sphingomonas olei TaxID=1886787 RepID=A0ABY2QGZ9_9SPHN|nr:hypothetical protein [Sphingomonas olei]THG39536.1 hypothetical protein E5988_10175 [Sphingomonas olei]
MKAVMIRNRIEDGLKIKDPCERLPALAAQYRVTLTDLSRIIGQRPRYLHRFVCDGVPTDLDDEAHDTLGRFFGVPTCQLGGVDPRWAKFRVAK